MLTAAGRLNLNLHRWLPSWPGTGRRALLRAGLTLIAAAAPLVPGPAWGQLNQVANWTGGNTSPHGLWGDPAKWDEGIVPINNAGTNFTVLVPGGSGVDFNRGTSNFIQAFSLGTDAELYFGPGQTLTVNGDAELGGLISATGTNSAFWSLATNAIFSLYGYPRLLASQSGTVGTRISSYLYNWDNLAVSRTIMQADGPGSLLELSYLRTLQVQSGYSWDSLLPRRINAQNGGRVDLSKLVRIENQTGGAITHSEPKNALEFNVESGGDLDLRSLEEIAGYSTKFNLQVPFFSLPALDHATHTTFNLSPGGTVAATNLEWLSGCMLNLSTNASFVAPELFSLASSVVNLATNASLVASNLVEFEDSRVALAPGQNFWTGPLLNIDNARLSVSGGQVLSNIVAASARHTISDPVTICEADGVGSRLGLSSLRTLQVQSDFTWDSIKPRRIIAKNGGLVDLSGLLRIENQAGDPPTRLGEPLNCAEFNLETNGIINLDSLETISGYSTKFNVRSGTLHLPQLRTATYSWFNLADGKVAECPELLSLTGSGVVVGKAATFNAPKLEQLLGSKVVIDFAGSNHAPVLTTFVDSYVALSANRKFTTGSLTNIDNSQFLLNGVGFGRVAATNYHHDQTRSETIFEADGSASLLDLSTIRAMQVESVSSWDGSYPRRINAKNEGRVDLSNLVRIENQTGSATDVAQQPLNCLEFNIQTKGLVNLSSLQEIAGYNTKFNIGVTNFRLPELSSISHTALNLDYAADVVAPKLGTANYATLDIAFGAGIAAPKLTNFINSSVVLSPGKGFTHGPIVNFNGSKIQVLGGETFAVAAPSYYSGRNDSSEILKADGEANGVRSYLDLRSVWSVNMYRGSIVASGRGIVDLSGASQVIGSSGNSSYWQETKAYGAGELRLGDAVVSGYARIMLQGDNDRLVATGLDLRYPARLSVGTGGELVLQKNFIFDNTTETDVALDSAVVRFAGMGGQTLEVGGRDNGTGVTAANFGLGVLVVGAPGQPSTVKLMDLRNNGHRNGTAGSNEVLYLYGTNGANGLRLLNGSKLVLNGLRAYARVGGTMTLLNSLIPPGTNSVRFDEGTIVNAAGGGPAILAMNPNSAVIPSVSQVEVTFDIPTQPGSFTPADVTLTGPGGAIAVSGVVSIGGNAYRISFPAQSAHGTYTVRVGPNISDLSGLVTQMDQNQNGLPGEADDAFTGTFAIDTQPAQIVSAWGLQGGNRIGVRFNEALNPVTATNAANYLVNGVAPASAAFGPDSQSIVLAIAGATVGETFTLNAVNVGDVVSNAAPSSATGRISPLTPRDIVGTVGSNPRDTGSTVTFDGVGFDTTASGTIGGSPDGFQFVYENRPSDFDLKVQLARLDWKSSNTEAGLMARESSAGNARFVMLVAYPTNGANVIHLNQRATVGSTWVNVPGQSNNAGVPFPNAWLRLKREGATFKAYRGTNGTDWVQIGEVTNDLPASLFVGMATASYNNTAGQTTLAQYLNYGDFAPSFLSQPQSQVVAAGATVGFGVIARGQAPLTYQWFFNGVPKVGATSDVLLLPAVTTNQAGAYFVTVGNSIGVATSQVATLTVYPTGGGGGFEADVAPRPAGNNTNSVSDWSQVGLFVAGLETPVSGNEFARADCAPRSTLGNGKLTVSDWTQAARYAAGLDPLTPTGGATNGLFGGSARATKDDGDPGPARRVRLGGTRATQGQVFTVPVELTAEGNENALGFSLVFDATRLRCLGASAETALAGTFLQVNTNQAPAGRVGIVLALPWAQSYNAGTVTVARVSFVATEALGAAAVEFADGPVVRELASVSAQVLPVVYQNGAALVVSRPRLLVPEIQPGAGVVLRLLGDDATDYVTEASANAAAWAAISTNRPVGGSAEIRDAVAVGQPARFYRAKVRE